MRVQRRHNAHYAAHDSLPLHPFPYGANREQQKAIARRYTAVPYIEHPLYSKRKALIKRMVQNVLQNVNVVKANSAATE
jgi:hypothetical protein